MATSFINLTPHEIVIHHNGGNGLNTIVPASGKVARVMETPSKVVGCLIEGIDIVSTPEFDSIINLPEPDGTSLFIVSSMVLEKVKNRTDVVAPATGPTDGALRNAAGHITGVIKLRVCRMD